MKTYTMTIFFRELYPLRTDLINKLRPAEFKQIEAELEDRVSRQYTGWDIEKVIATKRQVADPDDLADDVRYTIKVSILPFKG